jgi:hypothetical protein
VYSVQLIRNDSPSLRCAKQSTLSTATQFTYSSEPNHISISQALFKAKESMTADDGTTLVHSAKCMLGQIPGLVAVEVGPALEVTKGSAPPYAHGYDWGVVLTLSNREALQVYMTHPAHDE